MLLYFTYDHIGYLMYQIHYRVPLSYDLTTFQIQILGQNLSKIFVVILVQMMTSKGHFEIN